MELIKGEKIKVVHQGNLVEGEVIEALDGFTDIEGRYYWIKVDVGGTADIGLYSEDNLIVWNTVPKRCTCGATATYAPYPPPAHAYHCESIQ